MKFSTAFLLLAPTLAAASKSISAKNAGKVMRHARRVEDANAQGDDQVSYDFLAKYSLKLIGCQSGEQVVNAENGEVDYGAVIFRLCPSESGCNSDAIQGCDKGYGDFVVSLQTYVQAYFEDQRDNMQWDDNFQVDKYAECAEYKVEQQNDDQQEQGQYWVGPTCTEDELDIRLAVFDDETCTSISKTSFETISNGWTLPYSTGGIVSTNCQDCLAYNENQAAYEMRDMCLNLYMGAASACEASMEDFSSMGQNTNGCDYISEITPKAVKKASKKGGKVFGWIVFCLLVAGFGTYIAWWRKKKQSAAHDGLVA